MCKLTVALQIPGMKGSKTSQHVTGAIAWDVLKQFREARLHLMLFILPLHKTGCCCSDCTALLCSALLCKPVAIRIFFIQKTTAAGLRVDDLRILVLLGTSQQCQCNVSTRQVSRLSGANGLYSGL